MLRHHFLVESDQDVLLVAIVDIRRHADFRESDRGEGAIDRVGEGKEDGGAVREVDGLELDGGVVGFLGFDRRLGEIIRDDEVVEAEILVARLGVLHLEVEIDILALRIIHLVFRRAFLGIVFLVERRI